MITPASIESIKAGTVGAMPGPYEYGAPQENTLQRAKLYGPRHTDGGHYAPLADFSHRGTAAHLANCSPEVIAALCDLALRGLKSASLLEARAALIAELMLRLDDLQQSEAEYREMHDRHGDGSQAARRAWDLMLQAGDRARAALTPKEPS